MTGRRPTDVGATGPLTRPNTVSPFRPERPSPARRPLGASLSPPDRLVAYEARIRAFNAGVDQLSEAIERLDQAATVPAIDRAVTDVKDAWRELVELSGRPFRRPRP